MASRKTQPAVGRVYNETPRPNTPRNREPEAEASERQLHPPAHRLLCQGLDATTGANKPGNYMRPAVLGKGLDPKALLGFRLLICKMGRITPALGDLKRFVWGAG